MTPVRTGHLTCIVILSILLIGCSGAYDSSASPAQPTRQTLPPADTADPAKVPVSESNTTATVVGGLHGPHLRLLKMSAEQVEAALGRPTSLSDKGGQQYWEYPSLGLRVVVYKQQVLFLVQTQGSVTESLRIGDHEEEVLALVGHQLEQSDFDPNTKVGRVYLPDAELLISVTNGRASKAEVTRPGRDN